MNRTFGQHSAYSVQAGLRQKALMIQGNSINFSRFTVDASQAVRSSLSDCSHTWCLLQVLLRHCAAQCQCPERYRCERGAKLQYVQGF